MKSRTTKILMIVFLFVSMLAINGCSKYDFQEKEFKEEIRTVVIDNCEYLIYEHGTGTAYATFSFTHKGNCKNPIHKQENK